MNCDAFREHLPEFLYGELDAADHALAEAHRAACGRCDRETTSLRATMHLLDAWSPVPEAGGSAGEDRYTGTEAQPERAESAPRRHRFRWGALSGAAATLLTTVALVAFAGEVEFQGGRFTVSVGPTSANKEKPALETSTFLLILYEEAEGTWPRSELARIVSEYREWARELDAQGRLIAGAKLTDDGGHTLRGRTGEVSVRQGSERQPDDEIGGYFRVRAASYDDAIRLARTCPHLRYGRKIELRQIER